MVQGNPSSLGVLKMGAPPVAPIWEIGKTLRRVAAPFNLWSFGYRANSLQVSSYRPAKFARAEYPSQTALDNTPPAKRMLLLENAGHESCPGIWAELAFQALWRPLFGGRVGESPPRAALATQ
jgi:hypothetical protein